MKCIDVSSYNGTIDWKKVKQQNIQHVIIKAINKSNGADTGFAQNYTGASAEGFKIGVYNYSYAKNVTEAVVAANAVLNQIKGKDIPLGVWIDVEDNCQKNLGHLLIDIINTYGSIIQKAGYKFGIYTGLSFYNSFLKPYAAELSQPFWIARYPSTSAITPATTLMVDKKPVIGKSIWGWQYSSKCQVAGISGFTDISEIYDLIEAPVVKTVYIGHASIDENGKTSGGAAGDQTGKEVCIREWYNKPWHTVLRPIDSSKAEVIAKTMEDACNNNNIGYDQGQRLTLNTQAKTLNYDLTKVGLSECDCSSLVAVCVNAAGINISPAMTTRDEVSVLTNTGLFTAETSDIFIKSSANLKRGDILVGNGHTAIALGDGVIQKPTVIVQTTKKTILEEPTDANPSVAGWYKTTANLTLRYGAGTDKEKITIMPKGSKVQFFGRYTPVDGVAWCYVVYGNIIGFCSIAYLQKI